MPHVDANYRFIAASNEVNARITQRQQTLALYITLVLGLIAALVGFRGGGDEVRQALPVQWLALGFPVASLTLVLLNIRSERTLSNLRSFLSALERLDNAHAELPSYNTDPQWSIAANRARRLHDYTAALLVLSANAIALGALQRLYPQEIGHASAVVWLIGLVALLCVLALLWLPRMAYRPADGEAPGPAAK
jgi:O-antigen/teichoic acid export membrane protein